MAHYRNYFISMTSFVVSQTNEKGHKLQDCDYKRPVNRFSGANSFLRRTGRQPSFSILLALFEEADAIPPLL